jgi:hypothetical protein
LVEQLGDRAEGAATVALLSLALVRHRRSIGFRLGTLPRERHCRPAQVALPFYDILGYSINVDGNLSIIDDFARQRGIGLAWERSMDFMIDYLSEMKTLLPIVASRCLEAAKEFRKGNVGADELENARVSSWQYLDKRGASTDTITPEYCAIRAVICALYDRPQQGVDCYDLIGFFLGLADRFEDHSEEVASLLQKHFRH